MKDINQAGRQLVVGSVVLPHDLRANVTGTVVVMVEDVSRADAPSDVVGEQTQVGVSLEPGAALPFQIEIPEDRIDQRHSYSVRVHIDVSGSGQIEKGDFVSTQSYPVLTRGAAKEARIEVRRI